jgi:hypothetical protein
LAAIHRDTDDDWKQVSLIDDFGGKVTLAPSKYGCSP